MTRDLESEGRVVTRQARSRQMETLRSFLTRSPTPNRGETETLKEFGSVVISVFAKRSGSDRQHSAYLKALSRVGRSLH